MSRFGNSHASADHSAGELRQAKGRRYLPGKLRWLGHEFLNEAILEYNHML